MNSLRAKTIEFIKYPLLLALLSFSVARAQNPCESGVAGGEIVSEITPPGASRAYGPNIVGVRDIVIPRAEVKKNTGADRDLKITELTTRDGMRLSEQDIFGEKGDLTVAIDRMGNTHGHTYLIINGVRVDGRMFFSPHTEVREGWTFSNGLIIRYKNLPKRNREALIKWLESPDELHTPTCVAAACAILYEIGKFENSPGKRYWFPSLLLSHLAKTGLTGDDGQRIYPELYTINTDIRTMWDALPRWKAVPSFIFKVFFDPYTWQGLFKKKAGELEKAKH